MLRAAPCLVGVLWLAVSPVPPARGQEVRDTVLEDRVAECARGEDAACLVAIAAFDEAAVAFEQSSRHLGQGDTAEEALLSATRLRRQLGQLERAYGDVREFLDRFRATSRLPEAAEQAFLVALDIESRDDDRRAMEHYQAYLRDFALGGWDLYGAAHQRLGGLLMKQSCPIPGYFGACVELSLRRTECPLPSRHYLQSPHHPRLYWGEVAKRHPRDAGRLREARKHLRLALEPRALAKAEHDAAVSPDRIRMLANARSEALSLLATDSLEAFLALGDVPVDLSFEQPTQYDNPCEQRRKKAQYERSSRRFMQWLTDKVRTAERLRRQYKNAIVQGGPEGSVAAAARFALVVVRAGDSLYASGDEELACWGGHGGPAEKAEPLIANAVAAARQCDGLATSFAVGGAWVEYCRWQLHRDAPANFPRMSELFPAGVFTSLAHEDRELQPAPIAKVDAPPRLRPRPPRQPCHEQEPRGKSGGAGILGTLRMQEGEHLAPVFGRDEEDSQRLAYPETFPAELAKRYPPPWPESR